MEEIDQFDDFLARIELPEIRYMAKFNPDTGAVEAVGPSHAFENQDNKIEIDRDTAEMIIEGKVKLTSCFVDQRENKLEIAEIQSIVKIDDVLHRIVELTWSDIDRPDVYILYDKEKKILKFQLTEEFHGTKKMPEKYQPVIKRNVLWSGETEMNFLITEYNDPNILFKMISFKVSELVGKTKTIKNVSCPDRFSIYTRRIFKNYVMDIL